MHRHGDQYDVLIRHYYLLVHLQVLHKMREATNRVCGIDSVQSMRRIPHKVATTIIFTIGSKLTVNSNRSLLIQFAELRRLCSLSQYPVKRVVGMASRNILFGYHG